jgi:hypothetical protein
MKYLLLFAFLLPYPATMSTAQATNPSSAPDSTYPILIHVQQSHLVDECTNDNKGSSCSYMQVLRVVIDGKKYELTRATDYNVFRIGDYKAKIAKEKSPRPEEYFRQYEVPLSDGKKATFLVSGEFE